MKDEWTVRVWGVRGSAPAAGGDFIKYGGNTACISAECGEALIVLDAGSGLSVLGEWMRREGRKRADILLSHFHLDHLQGFFTFAPFLDPEGEICIYGPCGTRRALEQLIRPPYWPLALEEFPARIRICEISSDAPFFLEGEGGLSVKVEKGNHPGGSFLYRLDGEGRSLVHALDCEWSLEQEKRLADFARGADLLIWDADFAPGDQKAGWGHSTWEQGAAFGRRACVRQVLMTHYDRSYKDEFLQEQERKALKADGSCCFAREGMVIRI